MSKELEKQANAILRKANFFNDKKKKKDTRQTINGRKRRTSRKQKHK